MSNETKNDAAGGVPTRKLLVSFGHDVTEYDSVEIEVPANATPEEIRELLKTGVYNHICYSDDVFSDGPNMETADNLRITTVDDLSAGPGEEVRISRNPIPVDTNYASIGNDAADAGKKLERGEFTENQFILEVLNSTYRNHCDPESTISRAFIKSYEEASMEDTQALLERVIQGPYGALLPTDQDEKAIAVTLEDKDGDVDTHLIYAPALIPANGQPLPILYPYRNHETGETALVYQEVPRDYDQEEIHVLFADGHKETFADAAAFNKTGMRRENDIETGVEIIETLRPYIDASDFEQDHEIFSGAPEQPVTSTKILRNDE